MITQQNQIINTKNPITQYTVQSDILKTIRSRGEILKKVQVTFNSIVRLNNAINTNPHHDIKDNS